MVVAINDPFSKQIIYVINKYDSVHGHCGYEISSDGNLMNVNGNEITHSKEDPANIKWSEHDVDYVVESTGVFMEGASKHLEGGAKVNYVSTFKRCSYVCNGCKS